MLETSRPRPRVIPCLTVIPFPSWGEQGDYKISGNRCSDGCVPRGGRGTNRPSGSDCVYGYQAPSRNHRLRALVVIEITRERVMPARSFMHTADCQMVHPCGTNQLAIRAFHFEGLECRRGAGSDSIEYDFTVDRLGGGRAAVV